MQPSRTLDLHLDGACDSLKEWISPRFLRSEALQGMRARFAEEGSMKLVDFLLPHQYAAVMRALPVQQWTRVGPPNIANYRTAVTTASSQRGEDPDDLTGGIEPDAARRLFNFMAGRQFLSYVVSATGAPVEAVAGALRCFAHGDYTLIADAGHRSKAVREKEKRVTGVTSSAASPADDAVGGDAAGVATVDVALFCVPPVPAGSSDGDGAWVDSAGGFTAFITADEEVASVSPQPNTLSIMLVMPGVMSFVKYVTASAPSPRYDVALRFAGEPGGDTASESGSDGSDE